jgi:hypothetical protein
MVNKMFLKGYITFSIWQLVVSILVRFFDDLISRWVNSSDAEKFAEICPCPCNSVGWGVLWWVKNHSLQNVHCHTLCQFFLKKNLIIECAVCHVTQGLHLFRLPACSCVPRTSKLVMILILEVMLHLKIPLFFLPLFYCPFLKHSSKLSSSRSFSAKIFYPSMYV